MASENKRGQILVPSGGLIVVPPWVKRDESTEEGVPVLGQIKPKESKNKAKRRRTKERAGGKRVSGRVKCQRRLEAERKQNRMPTEADTDAMNLELTALRLEVERLRDRLNGTTVRGERFLIEMDIETAEKLIARIEAMLAKDEEPLAETEDDE